MEKLRALIDQTRVALARLSQREQLWVLGGAAGGVLIILIGIGAGVSHAIASEEHRVGVKTKMLSEVLALQADYKQRKAERERRMRALAEKEVGLITFVNEQAKKAEVTINQLTPQGDETGADGIVEARLTLQATGLSADRLEDFLSHLESSHDTVVVRRLKVWRLYRGDVAELNMSVSAFKLAGAPR